MTDEAKRLVEEEQKKRELAEQIKLETMKKRGDLLEKMAERQAREIANDNWAMAEGAENALDEAEQTYYAEKEAREEKEYEDRMNLIDDEDEQWLMQGELDSEWPEIMENATWRKRFCDYVAEEIRGGAPHNDLRTFINAAETVELHRQQSLEDPGAEEKYNREYARLEIQRRRDQDLIKDHLDYEASVVPSDDLIIPADMGEEGAEQLRREHPIVYGDPDLQQRAADEIDRKTATGDFPGMTDGQHGRFGSYRDVMEPLQRSAIVEEIRKGRKLSLQEREELSRKLKEEGLE